MNIGIVGMMGVGKTSILRKFINPDKEIPKDNMSTIGVDLHPYYINFMNTPIKIKIWDTAGQERFATLTQSYLKPLDGVLLVFAFNNIESL